MEEKLPGAGDDTSATEIRAFLIADVRGYTRFTQERGDEAAADLAKRFAKIAREGIEARGGSVIELRGDEALAVFGSPRQAIRAASELQERFVEETISDPSLPLLVGIGLDAGEAVPVEGGYRGGALNLAARLCGQAGAGEILASQEIVHLARRVDGVRYEDRGSVTLKGLSVPVRVTKVSSERGDAAQRLAPFVPAAAPQVTTRSFLHSLRGGRGLVALLTSLAVVVAGVAFALIRSGQDASAVGRFAPDSVGLINLKSGTPLDSIDLGARPEGIAIGGGSAWVTHPTEGTVSRIDVDTRNVVDTIKVGHDPAGIAVSEEAVWVANSGAGTLSQIDVATATEVATIVVGNGPTGVAVGHGSVWVVNSVDGTLARVDPDKAKVTETVYVGDGPTGVQVGNGAVWITNSAGATVSQVDPGTMTVVQTHTVGNGPVGLAVVPDGVWVANRLDGTVSRIDPDTNAATSVSTGGGSSGITASSDALWVANEFDGTISRIDMATREKRTIPVGNAPSAVAAADGQLWVTVRGASPSHLGGTLSVASKQPAGQFAGSPATIDPAVAYDSLAWQVLIMTNDGLVGFRKVQGAEGALLIPDLATSLPKPTDGGTTYTFRIRPGISYSTGDEVRPEDFRRAIERIFTTGNDEVFGYYDGIVGTGRCIEDPARCNLSKGIPTSKNAVSFRLERPDPDFLYKLALPFAFAVPAATGAEESREPLPATGPYMFESYDHEEGFVLVRNPRFQEWSHVAQPAGYPDRIEWRYGVGVNDATDQVVEGDLDWVYTSLGLSGLEQIKRQAPQLLHSYPQSVIWYLSLNTNKPPFDDIRVRRALNLAIDRSRVAEMWGGEEHARPTCQVLPPGISGYEPYCPYMVPGSGGGWTPDFAKAGDLIRRAGAKGASVEVWGFSVPGEVGLKVTKYVTKLLDSLGLRATHRSFQDIDAYFDDLFAGRPQIGIAGWGQDYPTPSNFIDPLLSCSGAQNSSGLCDSRLDRMIDRALRLQVVDPARSRELWAAADRRIVDLAPWAPLVNPVGVDIVSERVGNYQRNPQWGLLLDQLWIR